MADLAFTAGTSAHARVTHPQNSERFDFAAAEAITIGQLVYLTAAGKAGVADANAAGKQQVRGVALNSASAGRGVTVLKRGPVDGFVISALAYDAVVYLSDTAGAVGTTAGTMSVPVARVMAIPDDGNAAGPTKVLYFDCNWITTWA